MHDRTQDGPAGSSKRERLQRLLRERLSSGSAEHPLSFNQRSIWFLNRLSPDSSAYNVPYVFYVHSPVDAGALRRAFCGLVGRHAILRTTYAPDRPLQRVNEDANPDFESRDASAWTEEALWSAVAEEAHRPFDIVNGPVLRVRVYERGAAPAVLVVTFHHIAYDLWSMMTLLHELGALYASEVSGTPAPLPPLRHQYIDFVRWQSQMLSLEEERLWSYWRAHLEGELPVLRLPLDHPRPAVQAFEGATYRRELPRSVVLAVQALAREEQATIFPVLLSAFQVLLHGLSGQADLVVGTPTAGRSAAAFEELIGYFLNTLPIRSRLAGDPDFRAFLRQTWQAVRGALDHQDYPFERLVERLKPPRSAAHSAVFQAMFVLNRPHRLERQRSGGAAAELLLERVPFDLQVAQFDLSLQIDQVDDSFTAVWEYDLALFEESTVARWAARFERLLEAAAAGADRPLSQLVGLGEPGSERMADATGTPGSPRAGAGRPFIEPRTAAEEAIAAIFAEVLGLDRVSACDSLFDLGADSAHAAQVVSRLATLAGRRLETRLVFEAPTAEQLGARLESILLEQAQYAPDPE